MHFLDEFVIFQVEFVGISVVFIILVSVNVAMKHLTQTKHTIVVFQRIQHVQRMNFFIHYQHWKAIMWIVLKVKSFLGAKSVMFKMIVLWQGTYILQYLPIALLLAMFIVRKEVILQKFVICLFQMFSLEKILTNLLSNIVWGEMESPVNQVMDQFIINAMTARKLMIWKHVQDIP